MTDLPVKTMAMLKRRPGMSREEFEDYWLNVHADYVAAIPEIARYTQRHIVASDEPENPFGIDGFVILEYRSLADKEAAWAGDLGVLTRKDAEMFRSGGGRVHFRDTVIVDRTTTEPA